MKLIISLAVAGREDYPELQKGLIKTLPIANCESWILNEFPADVTPHDKVPYLFKFDLIQQAINKGFRKICWADSTMRLLKDPFELLEQSETGIVAFHNEGHPVYKYISDYAAGILRNYYDDIHDVDQTWGGFIMWDFTKEKPWEILNEVFALAELGALNNGHSTREGFVAHRHDQAILSILFHHYKVPLLPYGIIAAKPGVNEKTYIQYGD